LLEGLEVVEINLNDLLKENRTFRIDSEYFKKKYLKNLQNIKKSNSGYIKLNEAIVHMSGGATPLGAEYQTDGVPFLRVQNIMQNYFNLNDVVYLSKKQDGEIKRSRLKEKDVLLTITGVSYGKSATITKKLEGANINQHSVKISLNNKLNPYFLSTFLNCKFGKLQSDKNIVGVTRPALDYMVIRNFAIPNLSDTFQEKIEELIKLSEKRINHSKQIYTQAENLLLEEIGLKDFTPSNSPQKEGCPKGGVVNVNIKSFKDSFLSSGRLDAEYYQSKYEEVVERIKENNYEKLADIINIKKSIEPGSNAYSEEGLPFLRVADYNKLGLSEPQKCLSITYVKENAKKLNNLKPKAETILFSKDGTVGMAYMLKENQNFITSGAILHLTVKNKEQILPEYLTLVLNSKLVQMQAERDAGGSIIMHWRVGEIENVIVPIIDFSKQQKIANLVEESFKLKKQSEQLLELAKTAVEKAIEESEEKAMEYINKGFAEISNNK
jgi:restriction endonuclease S subunit